MQMKLRLLFLVIFLFTSAAIWAQREVSGQVTDNENRSPLQGVNVTVKNSRVGTATDADGNRITWIKQMESLVLKPDVTHKPSIEEAREQLERTLSRSVEPTTDKVRELDVQLRAMRQIIGAIGLPDAATNRVMERLNTRLKLELGVMSLLDGDYLWETVGSGKQGRLF